MARFTKNLKSDRESWTFGDLVYFHLLKYGTRPEGAPSEKSGKVWELDAVAELLGYKSDRAIRNWMKDENLPDSVAPLSMLLFGDNSAWDEARAELQRKFEQGWAARQESDAAAPTVLTEPEIKQTADASPNSNETSNTFGEDGEEAKPEIPARPDTRLSLLHSETGDFARKGFAGLSRKRITASMTASLAIVVGAYAWINKPRLPELPAKPIVVATTPKVPEVAKPSVPVAAPNAAPSPPAQAAPPKPAPPIAEHARQPTQEEKQAEEKRRLAEKEIAARQAAFDAEQQRKRDEAIRLDQQQSSARDLAAERNQEARVLAGLGYRLTENRSIPGSSSGYVLAENAMECAVACTRENCDAFGFYRMQYPAGSRAKRYCYLFRKPFEEATNYPGYVLGEPVAKADAQQAPRAAVVLAQATTPATDEVTQCSSGPVKVSGFTLACDQILGGGTAPGGQERFAVSNVNECAAKCRPNKSCTGFTFNSGDPEGRHACQLFGGKAQSRESLGWISGTR